MTLSGAGAYTLHDQSQFDKDVSDHVKFVQNQVNRVAAEQGTEPTLKFRNTWQNAQADISTLYTKSQRDSNLTPEELEKNKQYQEYLISASGIISEMSEGRQPDRTELNKTSASLII